MATITLGGNPVNTVGNLPEVGSAAPDFVLTKTDLSDTSLKDYTGKTVILNIFPSVDTAVCAASARKFNAEADKLDNVVVLGVSKDLPFAHARFCEMEGLETIIPVTELRDDSFGQGYGVRITDGPLAGLLARAVVIVDGSGKVTYTELVPEIKQEPDYGKALAAV